MSEIPSWAVRHICMIPHLRAEVVGSTGLEVRYGEQRTRFTAVPLPRVGTREREWLLSQRHLAPSPVLILTHRLSEQSRDELASAGLSWVEGDTGVVHLDAPPLLVHWALPRPAAEKKAEYSRPRVSLRGIGSTVGELLLAEYRHREFTLSEAASRAGASKQRTSQILSGLVDAGWVEASGQRRNRTYRLRDPAALLERWADQLRAPETQVYAYRWTRSTETLFSRLTVLDQMQIRWAIGGVAASHLHDPVLAEMPVPTVWIEASQDVREVIDVLEAEPIGAEESANVVFWLSGGDPAMRFATRLAPRWMKDLSLPVVSMPRAYAEARRMGGRAVDAAEVLREEMLS